MRLYDYWLRTAAEHASRSALRDTATGVELSFEALRRLAAEQPVAPAVVFATGRGVEFILAVLAAWRDGSVLCPLDAQAPPAPPPEEILAARRIAHIKLTSGTTGVPRQVLFREEQLLADCENICATMGLHPDLPNLGVISLAHSYGFSNLVLPLLLRGVPLVLAPNALPASVEKALAPGFPAVLPAVPAMWRAWHSIGLPGPRIALAISAGAPLAVELERSIFECCGLKVHNFYGASECGGIAFDRTAEPRSDAEIVGAAMDNVAHERTPDGRLVVRSAAVGELYWPPMRDGAETLGGGRYVTGDLVELDGGVVRLTGRAGEVINVAGRKLHPGEIEEWLLQEPGVRHAVAFGVPSRDAERCDDIAVVVALERGAPLSVLQRTAAAALLSWKCPRHWRMCDGLQPDHRGKISRALWRRRFLSGDL